MSYICKVTRFTPRGQVERVSEFSGLAYNQAVNQAKAQLGEVLMESGQIAGMTGTSFPEFKVKFFPGQKEWRIWQIAGMESPLVAKINLVRRWEK